MIVAYTTYIYTIYIKDSTTPMAYTESKGSRLGSVRIDRAEQPHPGFKHTQPEIEMFNKHQQVTRSSIFEMW